MIYFFPLVSSACSPYFYFILICLLTSSSVTSPCPSSVLALSLLSAGHRDWTETSRGEDVSALIPLCHISVWSYRGAGLESPPSSLAFSLRSPGCRSPVSLGFEWLGWEWDVSVCVRAATPASINHKTAALRLVDTHTQRVVYLHMQKQHQCPHSLETIWCSSSNTQMLPHARKIYKYTNIWIQLKPSLQKVNTHPHTNMHAHTLVNSCLLALRVQRCWVLTASVLVLCCIHSLVTLKATAEKHTNKHFGEPEQREWFSVTRGFTLSRGRCQTGTSIRM